MQRPFVRVMILVVCAAVLHSAGHAQAPLKPFSKEDVVTLLKGDVLPNRVGELAKGHRISFGLTHEAETELRKAGADDDLINVLRVLAPKSAMRTLDQPAPLKRADKNSGSPEAPSKHADHSSNLEVTSPTTPRRVLISSGVSSGRLINSVHPDYPPLALQARITGSVTFQAEIGKDGTVQNLKLISGHPMLVPAAIEAVKQWRYRPYTQNGEAVEVETQVTVNFTLSGG